PISALSYGSRLNGVPKPDVLYLADTAGPNRLFRSLNAARNDFTQLSAYPGLGARSLIVDPQNLNNVYALDFNSRIWASKNAGGAWVELTANLHSLCDDVSVLEIFSPSPSTLNTVLLAGGQGGVFQMRRPGAAGT